MYHMVPDVVVVVDVSHMSRVGVVLDVLDVVDVSRMSRVGVVPDVSRMSRVGVVPDVVSVIGVLGFGNNTIVAITRFSLTTQG